MATVDTQDPNARSGDWFATNAAPAGAPSFDRVNQDYQTYLGRPLTQGEYDQYWAHKTDYTSNNVSSTPEAQARKTATGGADPAAYNAVANAYKTDLGREGSSAEINSWLNDPQYGGNVAAIENALHNSDEATTYRTKGTAPPPADPGTGGTTGGGSSGSSSGGGATTAPPGTGWQAPAGPPASGFGAAQPTYTPPVYASNPDAPQFTPLPAYVAPTWTGGDFVNPTMEEVQAGPGYQSRLDQLIKTRERQSAAQGTILSGGTLKALDRAGQDYATNEYQTYRTNALENYKQRYGQFTDAAGMNLAARTLNANENNQTFQNTTNTYNTGNARTLSDYLTNVTGQRTATQDAGTSQRNAETDYWSRLQDLNNTGANLAGGSYRV